MSAGLFRRVVVGLAIAALAAPAMAASNLPQAVTAAADRLVVVQDTGGSWAGAEGYTGPMVAGLVNAYLLTGTVSYYDAAKRGGDYILASAAEAGFYGDEAWGLTVLSQMEANPTSNAWRTAVADFYARAATAPGGTAAYIADLKAGYAEDSVPVFYLAHHAVASEYVGATDKAVWRQAVIDTFAYVNDLDTYPVMSLGTAVFALAQTGSGLDATVIPTPPIPERGTYAGYRLDQLPAVLAGHQVPATALYGSSFFAWFDHSQSPAAGYTEDTVYGTLGLMAATGTGSWDYTTQIQAARRVLANGDRYGAVTPDFGVLANGVTREHVWNNSFVNDAFAGEVLIVLNIEPAVQFVSAVSRKTHGTMGTFDIDLMAPMGGFDVAVECRKNGPTKVLVTFDELIVGSGPGGVAVPVDVAVVDSAGSIITVSAVSIVNDELTIDMSGAANASRVKIMFPGITGISGSVCTGSICLVAFLGDVNGDGRVNVQDMTPVRNNTGEVPLVHHRCDANTDGRINTLDMTAVRNNVGLIVPPGGC
ncbi:MAG: hypothetical protein KA354_24595 [Phycisphaerae bacterium]|nr:hypothetical protein [Phycisphaerae bacterium]